ncbi:MULTISPECIES: tyrosine-type recombinase/integrase [unclassified Pseudonocardia]|uniref:tyrosine-type recombinase/integrase n=1 Tax=unclassified Pseudonocardia TaxID=2619320 RepID=UPI0007619D22|nr:MULTISPECIES: tyrosine-type recombinase/integrase [unclassified Pseudonocardia]
MDASLVDDWKLSLTIANKAPSTITGYLSTARCYVAWCGARSGLTKRDLQGFLAHRIDAGYSPAGTANHYRCLQAWFKWMVEEEIIERSPFDKLKAPFVPEKEVPLLTRDEVSKLLNACKQGRKITGLRDTAVIRLLLDTGLRASELCRLTLDDVDFDLQTIRVYGKGRKFRTVVFGDKPALALRRYLRARQVDSESLFLSQKGPMTVSTLGQALHRRGALAGVKGVHPHRFRHQFAHDWLAAGGSEGDLQRLAGWSSRAMLQRYGSSGAAARAVEAHRSMGLDQKYA